jgi:S-adenosylmethionine synthetase
VLGSAVFKVFKDAGHDIVGLARSRFGDTLEKLDLTNSRDVDEFFTEARPDCKLNAG